MVPVDPALLESRLVHICSMRKLVYVQAGHLFTHRLSCCYRATGCQITCVSLVRTVYVGNLNAQTVKASKLLQTKKTFQPGQEWEPVIRPPWLAEGQGKARRLFEADQGPAKRVIRLARDQTILKLTPAEFKDRLADVLSLLPELPLSALPPKMLSKLVMMPPNNIANQLVLLQGLFRGKQDINELLLKEPTLLTIPYAETALHFQRLKVLLESPRKKGGQHPYGEVDYDDFVATHPEFLIPENVVMALRSLCVYLGRALDQDAEIQDYVMGNPGMLLKGYKHLAHAPVLHMSSQDDSCSQWWQ
jgi:hypothetical protein